MGNLVLQHHLALSLPPFMATGMSFMWVLGLSSVRYSFCLRPVKNSVCICVCTCVYMCVCACVGGVSVHEPFLTNVMRASGYSPFHSWGNCSELYFLRLLCRLGSIRPQ